MQRRVTRSGHRKSRQLPHFDVTNAAVAPYEFSGTACQAGGHGFESRHSRHLSLHAACSPPRPVYEVRPTGLSADSSWRDAIAAGNGPNEPPMSEEDAVGALSDLLPGRRAGIRAHMLPLARTSIWDSFSRQHQGETQTLNIARRAIFQ